MKILRVLLAILVFPFLLQSNILYAEDSETLLAVLRSRDEQFDNSLVNYTTRNVIKVNPNEFWTGDFSEDQIVLPLGTPKELETVYEQQLIVRGNEATFIRKLDETLFPEKMQPGMIFPMPYTKWSNTEGKQREIVDHYPSHHEKHDMILEILPAGPSCDIAQEQRMEIEFSLGFGFGKRIINISSIEEVPGGMLLLKGTIQIWTEDKSTYELLMDKKSYLVREAKIKALVGTALSEIEVKTNGVAETDNISFASSGSYKRTMWGISEGQKLGYGKEITSLNLDFKSAEFDLSDERYTELVSMEVPEGTYIMDRIAEINYTKGEGISILKEVLLDEGILSNTDNPKEHQEKDTQGSLQPNLIKKLNEKEMDIVRIHDSTQKVELVVNKRMITKWIIAGIIISTSLLSLSYWYKS